MFFNICSLVFLSFIPSTLTSTLTCELPILRSQYTSNIPSWLSQNFSCTGSSQVYEVRPSPGKGLGVFALHTLVLGDIIMREAPVIAIRQPTFHEGVGYPLSQIGASIRAAFDSLSFETQAEVESLIGHVMPSEEGKMDPLVTIFRNNAYITGENISLLPKIARINHSCRPNTGYSWNEQLGKQTVYATRRIEEGEELSVTYIPLLHTHEDRQTRLDQYGFTCACEACSASAFKIRGSDKRRKEIKRAFQGFEGKTTLEPATTVVAKRKANQMAKESSVLVQLVETEALADYFANAYRIAAICHARIKDWQPAAQWAHKGYQLELLADPKSRATKQMKMLTELSIAGWNEHLRDKATSSA